jgi:excisionase family DNA binding protein
MRTAPAVRAPLFLTVTDAARRLALHEQTIRAMIRRGELTAVRLGRFLRVFTEAVETRRPHPRAGAPGRGQRPAARRPGRRRRAGAQAPRRRLTAVGA